jgi:hypothetical protein
MKCRDGRITASGIHVVPEPIRSIEIPSGPSIDIGIVSRVDAAGTARLVVS